MNKERVVTAVRGEREKSQFEKVDRLLRITNEKLNEVILEATGCKQRDKELIDYHINGKR